MEVVLQLPDEIAQHLAGDANITRSALEAIALEGFRSRRLSIWEVAQLLGLTRMQAQDFVGTNGVPLDDYHADDLAREVEELVSCAKAGSAK